MQKNIYTLKKEIIEAGRRVYDRGYVASNDGNISARVDAKRVIITPTGVSKGFMKTEDLVLVDMDGNVLEGRKKPSSEIFMHLRMYKDRPDINSVCHAHPPYATGFAVAGLPLDKCILPEVIIVLGGIPLAEYGTPGTDEFYQPVLKYLKDYDAFLLANHGALTIGSDVFNAYHKMETLEHFAHIAFVAMQLGQANAIAPEEVQKLFTIRKKMGIDRDVECLSCDTGDDASCTIAGSGSAPASAPAASSIASSGSTPASASTASSIDKEALVKEVTEAILKQLKS